MITPLNILITIANDKSLHSGHDGVNTLYLLRPEVRRELRKGFLLLELALALVIMSIAMVATLHLVNGITRIYAQATTTTMFVRAAQWVGEDDTGRCDERNDVCEIAVCPVPQEMLPADNDPFSWIMRHVAVHKVAVRNRHDTQYPPFEMMVVRDG